MRKIVIIYFLLLFAGCSSYNVVKNSENNNSKNSDKIESYFKSQAAQNKFINGLIKEQKGDYSGAILEYYDALNYDSSAGIFYTISKDYFALDKVSNALKSIEIAIKKDPSNYQYRFLAAHIYKYAHLRDSAITQYKLILKSDSTNPKALFGLARLYEAKRPMQSMRLYKKILEVVGPEWEVLVSLADLSQRLGKLDETIKYAKKMSHLAPSNLNLKKLLVELYIRNKEYENGLKILNELIPQYPNDLQLIEYKANIYVLNKEWRKSFEQYSKYVKSNDVSFGKKFLIAASFINQAQTDNDTTLLPFAEKLMLQIDSDSLDWRVKAALGDIYQRERRDSLAIEYLKQAVNLAEWNSNIWVQLGGLLFDNHKYDEAITEMSKAVNNFPDDFVINLILGLSYSQKQNNVEAKKYLLKAVSLNPNDLNANSALGFTLYQLKEYSDAEKYLNNAIKINPKNPQIYGMLGMIYDDLKEWGKCDTAYMTALRLDSTSALTMNNYAYSLTKRDSSDLDFALKLVNKALEKEPENSSYLDTKGWILYKLGRAKEAVDYVYKALQKDENNTEVLEHMGKIYLKLGENKKGQFYLEKAKKQKALSAKEKQGNND